MNKRQLAKLIENIRANPAIARRLKGEKYVSPESLADDAVRYLAAIKERRMVCVIPSVSRSGMSRTFTFHEVARHKPGEYGVCNFWSLFRFIGGYPSKEGRFRINGCGMDMIFHVNYEMVHALHCLGACSGPEAEVLAQRKPPVL